MINLVIPALVVAVLAVGASLLLDVFVTAPRRRAREKERLSLQAEIKAQLVEALGGKEQTARSRLSHRFEEWDGPPGIGIIGGVRKPKA